VKLIILDRDGVINQDSDAFVKSPDEWIPLPGSIAAIARLSQAGYTIAIATNQSGLARGLFDMTTLCAIHTKLHDEVAQAGGIVDAVFLCPHGPDDHCTCRKPLPGMFNDIARRYDIDDLQGVPAVGDSLRDLQAAYTAGCHPWLVLTGNGQKTQHSELPPGTRIAADLSAVVDALLQDA
jgi:D-glycero-D-manno-heptose 1,7-bisphosphate phosphatase